MMTNLLIHSMSELADLILACLDIAAVRNVVEIGAEFGGMSQRLFEYSEERGGQFTSIDPMPRCEFLDWAETTPHVRHIALPSLEAMPTLADVDAWIIDGDHNYHTVSNELAIARRLAQRDGKPFLAILHDVGWPCARRDLYYAPDTIPAEHCHPHSWEGGVTIDHHEVVPHRGFRGMGQFACATVHGGPRNGVLTAIEDFLDAVSAEGAELGFAFVPAVFGLGVVFAGDAAWSTTMAERLLPFHDNPLIARLEENRLRNYLRVIDMQDDARLAARAA